MSVYARQSPLLTLRETAAFLRQSERSIRRKVAAGDLPAIRLGGPGTPLRFDSRELESWLRENHAPAVSDDGLREEQLRPGAASPERAARPQPRGSRPRRRTRGQSNKRGLRFFGEG
jgi:excisionase family DNA binding protein